MLGLGLQATLRPNAVATAAMRAASAYRVRVLADGGTIEGYQCMVDKLTFLFQNP
jgi:hypothetical protein